MDRRIRNRSLHRFLSEYIVVIMRRYLIAFILVLISVQVVTNAQNLSNKERRRINLKVLTLIEEYERTASLSDSEEIYSFLELFQSPETQVYCDLMGTTSYQKSVTAREYVQNATSNNNNLEITVKNVRKGEITWENGSWIIPVVFMKGVYSVDKNGVLFSASEYFGTDYQITLNVAYTPGSESCRIASVKGKMDTSRTFPSDNILIVEKNYDLNERGKSLESKIMADGRSLEYNSFDQAIIPSSAELSIGDPDVIIDTTIIAESNIYKLVKFGFKPIRNRFKARAGVAPFMAYSASSTTGAKASGSFAFEAGVDFGTTFSAGNAKLGIFAGAALSMSSVSLKRTGDYSYKISYLDDKPVNGRVPSGYHIQTTLNYRSIVETQDVKFKDLVVPVYIEAEHRVSENFLITWSVGAKTYFSVSTELGEYGATGKREITAIYPNADLSELPEINVMNGFLNPIEVYARNPFSVSMMANVGADINISKNRMFATFKLGYEHGLTEMFRTEGCSKHGWSVEPPILYHPDGEYICHSLASGLALRRQAIWLELGIKVKM